MSPDTRGSVLVCACGSETYMLIKIADNKVELWCSECACLLTTLVKQRDDTDVRTIKSQEE